MQERIEAGVAYIAFGNLTDTKLTFQRNRLTLPFPDLPELDIEMGIWRTHPVVDPLTKYSWYHSWDHTSRPSNYPRQPKHPSEMRRTRATPRLHAFRTPLTPNDVGRIQVDLDDCDVGHVLTHYKGNPAHLHEAYPATFTVHGDVNPARVPHGRPWVMQDEEDGEWYCAIYKKVTPLCGSNELLDRATAGSIDLEQTYGMKSALPPPYHFTPPREPATYKAMAAVDKSIETEGRLTPCRRFPVKWGEVALPVREIDIACLNFKYVDFLRTHPRAMPAMVNWLESQEFQDTLLRLAKRHSPFTPWTHNNVGGDGQLVNWADPGICNPMQSFILPEGVPIPQTWLDPGMRLCVPPARECLYYIEPLEERSRNDSWPDKDEMDDNDPLGLGPVVAPPPGYVAPPNEPVPGAPFATRKIFDARPAPPETEASARDKRPIRPDHSWAGSTSLHSAIRPDQAHAGPSGTSLSSAVRSRANDAPPTQDAAPGTSQACDDRPPSEGRPSPDGDENGDIRLELDAPIWSRSPTPPEPTPPPPAALAPVDNPVVVLALQNMHRVSGYHIPAWAGAAIQTMETINLVRALDLPDGTIAPVLASLRATFTACHRNAVIARSVGTANVKATARAAIVASQLVSNPPLPRIVARQANAVTSLPVTLADMTPYYNRLQQPGVPFSPQEEEQVQQLVGVGGTVEERRLQPRLDSQQVQLLRAITSQVTVSITESLPTAPPMVRPGRTDHTFPYCFGLPDHVTTLVRDQAASFREDLLAVPAAPDAAQPRPSTSTARSAQQHSTQVAPNEQSSTSTPAPPAPPRSAPPLGLGQSINAATGAVINHMEMRRPGNTFHPIAPPNFGRPGSVTTVPRDRGAAPSHSRAPGDAQVGSSTSRSRAPSGA